METVFKKHLNPVLLISIQDAFKLFIYLLALLTFLDRIISYRNPSICKLRKLYKINVIALVKKKKNFVFLFQVLNLQLSDDAQGDAPADEAKLHGKPDKTLRFSLCSDNLEGVSEGMYSLKCQMFSHCLVIPRQKIHVRICFSLS